MTAAAPRLLCYSPYNRWELHGMWELTALHAARLRGASVKTVFCDGLYSDCDVFWASTEPRHPLSCTECQARVASLAHGMATPFEWLGRYLLPADMAEARRFTDALPAEKLFDATYVEWQIGAWVRSSVHSHLRATDLDLGQPEIEKAYRSYVYSGLVAAIGLTRLLDDFAPDVMFLFNGRMSSTQIALELALRRGIRVLCHERGFLSESLRVLENTSALGLSPLKQVWHDWGGVPLTRAELEIVHGHLTDREEGRDLNWKVYSPPPQADGELLQALSLDPARPLWVLFTSSDDEVLTEPEWQGPFAEQRDWIDQTVEYAAKHSELSLVIRAHPNTGGAHSVGSNRGQLQELVDLRANVPDNVRVVMPDDAVSSYSLMNLATVALSYQSTTGLEMAAKGKTAVVAAGSTVSDLPFVRTVESAASYEHLLDQVVQLPLRSIDAEIMRSAYRYAYGLFCRYNLPFPLVRMPDAHTGQLAYTELGQLEPGHDAHVDRLMRILLEGEPVCVPPRHADLGRSDGDEREWFGLG